VNRRGIQFSVLDRPNSSSYLLHLWIFIHHAYVSSIKSQYNWILYVSFISSPSTCPFQPTIIFKWLQEHNEKGSQPDASMHPKYVIFVYNRSLILCLG